LVLQPRRHHRTRVRQSGGFLHQATADTFYPIWTSNSPSFVGDFRAAGVTELEFDARTINTDFGDGTGFEMSIQLIDTKGTGSPADDNSACLVGPNIPLVEGGWKHFDFPIPSADVSALPAGWVGSFQAGDDWNDLITNVTEIKIIWSDPSLFAIFQQWNIGLDNITMHAAGTATVRNGSGINPLGFTQTVACELGATWTTMVDLVTPGAIRSILSVGIGGPTSGVFFPIAGEALILPPYLTFIRKGMTKLNVPMDPGLLGVCIYAQGSAILPDGTILFNNALDVVIGG